MELGLHRKATLERQFASPDSAAAALKLFWTIHSFDRRWSVGTGLPFCIPDADIDPQLPIPVRPVSLLRALDTNNILDGALPESNV